MSHSFIAAMDPNLFHLDWDRALEVLATIVLLSFILERTLAVVFENRMLVQKLAKKGLKSWIAWAAATAVCVIWDFDAISIILVADETSFFGALITGGVIAGGSKAAIKLFHDVLDFKSNALRELQDSSSAAKKKTKKKTK